MRMKLMGFLSSSLPNAPSSFSGFDRDYYERIEATVSTRAFPKEATLFGDRLFVQYTPQAAHTYLSKVAISRRGG